MKLKHVLRSDAVCLLKGADMLEELDKLGNLFAIIELLVFL